MAIETLNETLFFLRAVPTPTETAQKTFHLAVSFLYRIDDMRVYCGLADQTGERITP